MIQEVVKHDRYIRFVGFFGSANGANHIAKLPVPVLEQGNGELRSEFCCFKFFHEGSPVMLSDMQIGCLPCHSNGMDWPLAHSQVMA